MAKSYRQQKPQLELASYSPAMAAASQLNRAPDTFKLIVTSPPCFGEHKRRRRRRRGRRKNKKRSRQINIFCAAKLKLLFKFVAVMCDFATCFVCN